MGKNEQWRGVTDEDSPRLRYLHARRALLEWWQERLLIKGLTKQIADDEQLDDRQYEALRKWVSRLKETRSLCRVDVGQYGLKRKRTVGLDVELQTRHLKGDPVYLSYDDDLYFPSKQRNRAKVFKFGQTVWHVFPDKILIHSNYAWSPAKALWRGLADPRLYRVVRLHAKLPQAMMYVPKQFKGLRIPISREGDPRFGYLVLGDRSDPRNLEIEFGPAQRNRLVAAKPKARKALLKRMLAIGLEFADVAIADLFKTALSNGTRIGREEEKRTVMRRCGLGSAEETTQRELARVGYFEPKLS